jgi:hypothetical protein
MFNFARGFDNAVVAVVSKLLPSSNAGGSTQRPSIFAISIMKVSRSAGVSLANRMSMSISSLSIAGP